MKRFIVAVALALAAARAVASDQIQSEQAGAVPLVATGLQTVATIANRDRKLLVFQFDVTGQTLDAVSVFGRAHAGAQLVDFTPADWTSLSAGSRIRRVARSTTSTGAIVDGNIAATTAAQNGYFEMDIDGLVEIVVKASAAVDNGTFLPRWSVQ